MRILASNGNVGIANTSPSQKLDVTGNIAVSGTVDGRDLATDGSKLDGIESGATADQTASEILTLIKTVDGSGSGLDADLLDGISSASFLRSDQNDSTTGTLTISVADNEKLILSGTSDPYIRFKEGTTNKAYIQWSSSGYLQLVNQETSEALRIENGVHGLKFIEGGNTRTVFHTGNLAEGDGGLTTNNFTDADHSKLNGIEANATADQTASEILTLIKTVDGAGSGLDADTVDGISSASFVRSDASDTLTGGTYTFSSSTDQKIILQGSSSPYIRWQESSSNKAFIQWNTSGYLELYNEETARSLRIKSGESGLVYNVGGTERTVWHSGNDGAGSGLDADTVDGISSASFVRSDAADTLSATYNFSNSSSNDIINFSANASSDNRGIAFNNRTALSADYNDGYLRLNNANEFSNGVYTPLVMRADGGFNVDGTMSIDGSGNYVKALSTASDYSSLLRSDTADTASGDITFSGGAGAATIAGNSDIRFQTGSWTGNAVKIQHHSNYLYISGGSNGIVFREDGTDRWYVTGAGHLIPATDSTYNIGENGRRVTNGYFDTLYGDGSNLTGISAGATGGGSDEIFYENGQTVTTNYTITNGKNAMCAGPITINSGVTVTVGSGENLTIV